MTSRSLPDHGWSTNRTQTAPTRFGMLGTYPPTQCGLASFASSLRSSLRAGRADTEVDIVRIVEYDDKPSGTEVVAQLRSDLGGDPVAAAEALNRYDVAIVQHEYGIFGGTDGDQLLEILAHVRVPVIAVLHTVLSSPTPHQRYVLEELVFAVDTVVTLSATGYDRLRNGYDVDDRKIVMIPHGAWPGGRPTSTTAPESRPTVLTWGLLGPGKGLEWGVEALATLRELDPAPVYVIAGQTHPRVLARYGEAYRDSLRARAEELGVTDMLRFESGYLAPDVLRGLVSRADVILLPYDSHEQVTSGVLIEAVGSLTPVVSTPFPHAREMLAGGAGTLVPHADPTAIGAALHRVLTDRSHAASMVASAARIAPALEWPAVANRYFRVADELRQRDRVGAAR